MRSLSGGPRTVQGASRWSAVLAMAAGVLCWPGAGWAQVSVFGNFLDTTADKLLVSGALIGLLVVDRVSPWIALVIIGREILIIGLKGAVASTGDLVQPSIWGKAKANVQFIAILLAILRPGEPIGPLYLDEYAMIAAAVITVLSGAEYVMRFRGAVTGRSGHPE